MLTTISFGQPRNSPFANPQFRPLSPLANHWQILKPQPSSRLKQVRLEQSIIRRMVKGLEEKAKTKNLPRPSRQSYVLVPREISAEKCLDSTALETSKAKDEQKLNSEASKHTSRSPKRDVSVLGLEEFLEMNTKVVAKSSSSRGAESTRHYSNRDYIAFRKRNTIDGLMKTLDQMLEPILELAAFASCASSTSGSSQSEKSTARGSSSSSSSSKSSASKRAGQKRSLRSDGEEGSDQGDDGSGKERRGGKRPKVGDPTLRRFACPYFKHDPAKYDDKGACTGPGYPTIARLKEHIYRCHKQPANICVRCCESYENLDALKNHQRADVPCKKREPQSHESIDDKQFQRLKKKSPPAKSNVQKWEEIYVIIFPGTPAGSVPTPWYDYNEKPVQFCEVPKDVEEYDQLLREGVREELERRCDRFEVKVKNAFIDIVRSVSVGMLQKFRDRRQLTGTSEDSHRVETAGTTEVFDLNDFFFAETLSTFAGSPSQAFEKSPFPTFDFETLGDCMYQVNQLEGVSDSAYASASSRGCKE